MWYCTWGEVVQSLSYNREARCLSRFAGVCYIFFAALSGQIKERHHLDLTRNRSEPPTDNYTHMDEPLHPHILPGQTLPSF